jgi:hypothetical protein
MIVLLSRLLMCDFYPVERIRWFCFDAGRWTKAEHDAFVEGLRLHGREWKHIVKMVGARANV